MVFDPSNNLLFDAFDVRVKASISLFLKIRRFGGKRRDPRKMATSIHVVVCSLSRDRSNPVQLDVRFPADYSQLLEQVLLQEN